jgi:damage-control phosphatase, subfamily I
MKTYIDCIPCFYRQAVEISRLANLDDVKIKKIIDEIGKIIAKSKLDMTPPEMAGLIHSMIKRESNTDDFYKMQKKKSNELALSVYGLCKNKVNQSDDSLLTAVEMAIAGNIIDFGVKTNLTLKKKLKTF